MDVVLYSLIVFAAFITYVVDQSAKAFMEIYREFLQDNL